MDTVFNIGIVSVSVKNWTMMCCVSQGSVIHKLGEVEIFMARQSTVSCLQYMSKILQLVAAF